ncbi:MAG: magnesium/cobalt transporter CorA [Anaerolineae bacterium]|nr:magnesium/cobalt transporter CorA [Anaerolineae bacterium]
MIRALYRPQTGPVRTDLSPDEFSAALQDSQGLLWVDFVDEPPEVCEPILRETFGFHPLAIDDALAETHTPKLDDWGDYLYLVFRAIVFDQQADDQLDVPELDVFLGKNYIITYHEQPVVAVDRVWDHCQGDRHFLKRGAAYLLYMLTDELVANYVPVVDALDDTLDLIEDQLFNNPTSAALEQIFTLKRTVLHLRRLIMPQRDVLNRLARDRFRMIKDKERVFFRDVYDHLVRLYDLTESMRELVVSALNTYLSVVNNRMNDIVKTLTVFAALFMPLSFLVSFFGMNFFQAVTPLDVWTSQPVFVLTMIVIVFMPVGMLLWIRQRGWM